MLGKAPIVGGKGGDGEIWPVQNAPELVFKRYHRAEVVEDRARKIAFMRMHPPKFLQGESHKAIAWPVSAVLEHGCFVGFLMINALDCQLLMEFCRPVLPVALANQKTWNRFDRSKKNSIPNLFLLCYNLCTALRSLHRTGQYVHGDIKPKNVFVAPNGHIRLIDIDSIQISDQRKVLFPALVSSRTYRPQVFRSFVGGKLGNYQLQQSWDGFSFAVTCYELLMGIHPYLASHPSVQDLEEKVMVGLFVHGPKRSELATIPAPHEAFTRLPRAIQYLFQRSFAEQNVDLAEWQQVLRKEINLRTDSYLNQPTFVFRAEPNPVPKGQTTTLHWKVRHAKSAKISGIGHVPLQGTRDVRITKAKTFELTAFWTGGRSVKHLSVGLRKAMILVFSAVSPFISQGEAATLEWSLLSDFAEARIESQGLPAIPIAEVTGSVQVKLDETTIFTLHVLGSDGINEYAQTKVRTRTRQRLRENRSRAQSSELKSLTSQRRTFKKRTR